ncbi:MAG: CCA tRNA nucleotidyltransferase, partial [Acidimicrobiia bacterium]
ELELRIDDLAQREELDKIRPPIDGHDVMRYLGLKPSRRVGEIMNMLLEHRIEDGPYTEEEAYAMLDAWKAM